MKATVTSLAMPVTLCGIFIFWTTGSTGLFIPNLSESCFRCLCYVTNCNMTDGCVGGYCGPFKISPLYWIDGGNVTLPGDDPLRNHAWSDCAKNYNCSKLIIERYMQKYAKDCNGDGVTNCFDYILINGNGPYECTLPLNRTDNGKRWLKRYEECVLD